ncbi:MAG: hypothetical protein H6834_09655 [Planctomycetes bacterium]|nr:hypothetical protein [Planctomycetota bacterium]
MWRRVLLMLVGWSSYGYAIGCAHSDLYAQRNVVKLPLLVFTTLTVCAIAYDLLAKLITSRLTFARVTALLWCMVTEMAAMLLALFPVSLFLGLQLRASDDGRLGEYSLFLGLNLAFVAVAGVIALVRQVVALRRLSALSRREAGLLVAGWLTLSMVVGGQASFYLRPFFGFPATRGGNPPFALGAEPDARGATNFFEMVVQVVTTPPLPRGW